MEQVWWNSIVASVLRILGLFIATIAKIAVTNMVANFGKNTSLEMCTLKIGVIFLNNMLNLLPPNEST